LVNLLIALDIKFFFNGHISITCKETITKRQDTKNDNLQMKRMMKRYPF